MRKEWLNVSTQETTASVSTVRARPEGSDTTTNGIRVVVTPRYLEDRSSHTLGRYIWAYTVVVTNNSDKRAQLIRRQWLIVDGNGQRHEVEGEGVVGHQPDLAPGEEFEYSSHCPLEYPWGTMEGTYFFEDESGELFPVAIGRFFLVSPHV